MLKRYIVFACDEYEPQGGWEDVVRDGLDENGNPIARSFESFANHGPEQVKKTAHFFCCNTSN
jgi:hypothetical protein